MRRGLAIVSLSLVLYTVALVLGSFALCEAAEAIDVLGEWATQGHSAQVRIERCAAEPETFCGTVTWLWEPLDVNGQPVRDAKNPDPKLRERPVIGLALLRGFSDTANGSSHGQIYNPENGRTYSASLRLRDADELEVKGCVMFLCDTQVWRRLESLCVRPASTDAPNSKAPVHQPSFRQ